MKATFSLVMALAVLISGPLALAQDAPGAPAAGQMTQEEFNQAISQALQMLAASGDQEAFDTIKKAKENGGQLQISHEDAVKFIDRAQKLRDGGAAEAPKETPKEEPKEELKKPDKDRVTEAIRLLAKAGDKEAKDFIENYRRTKKLEIDDDAGRAFIARAEEKKLLKPEPTNPSDDEAPPAKDAKDANPPPDKDRVEEAVKLLSKKGDKEAREAIDHSRRNKGEMGLSDDQGRAMIDRAVEKGLMKEDSANPGGDEVNPQMMRQLIERLAQDGDRTAKGILRKAKKDDKELKYTEEEKKKILASAREAGLI